MVTIVIGVLSAAIKKLIASTSRMKGISIPQCFVQAPASTCPGTSSDSMQEQL